MSFCARTSAHPRGRTFSHTILSNRMMPMKSFEAETDFSVPVTSESRRRDSEPTLDSDSKDSDCLETTAKTRCSLSSGVIRRNALRRMRMDSIHIHESDDATSRKEPPPSKAAQIAIEAIWKRRTPRQLLKNKKAFETLAERANLESVCEGIRLQLHEEGLIGMHRHHLVKYPFSFVAAEVLEWLLQQGVADTEGQALAIMQMMERCSLVRCLMQGRAKLSIYSDDNSLYRFSNDEFPPTIEATVDEADLYLEHVLRQGVLDESLNRIRNHYKRGVRYEKTIKAKELVDFMEENPAFITNILGRQSDKEDTLPTISRKEAEKICQHLTEARVLLCCGETEQNFHDGQALFRFRTDQQEIGRMRIKEKGLELEKGNSNVSKSQSYSYR